MKRSGLLLLLFLLAGCGTATIAVDSWIVRRGSAATGTSDADAVVVGLTGVEVASHLGGIVVQRLNGEIDTLVYHRWAAPVGEMVRAWIRSRLSESPRIRGIVGPGDSSRVRVRVEVRRFEFVETGAGTSDATVELWGEIHTDHTGPKGQIRGDREPFGPIVATETAEVTAGEYLPVAMAVALGRAIETLVPIVEAAASAASQ